MQLRIGKAHVIHATGCAKWIDEARWVLDLLRKSLCFLNLQPDSSLQAVLENHGYLLADAALQALLPAAGRPSQWPSLEVPHTEWLSVDAVNRDLSRS